MLIQNNTPYQSRPTFGIIPEHTVRVAEAIEDLARMSKPHEVETFVSDLQRLIEEQRSNPIKIELMYMQPDSRYGHYHTFYTLVNGRSCSVPKKTMRSVSEIIPLYKRTIETLNKENSLNSAIESYKKINW